MIRQCILHHLSALNAMRAMDSNPFPLDSQASAKLIHSAVGCSYGNTSPDDVKKRTPEKQSVSSHCFGIMTTCCARL